MSASLSYRLVAIFGLVFLLSACESGSSNQDLKDFIAEKKRRPGGNIEPLPPFVPYKSFIYSAMTKRSPFDRPVEDLEQVILGNSSNVKPDFNREKEFLESFNLASMKMVGSLEKDGILWALINDGQGGIHRVAQGNYLGKNHGRVVTTSASQLDIIEIVPNGTDGWVERPKIIQLSEKD